MPTNERHTSKLSTTGRKQLLDGVIIPRKPVTSGLVVPDELEYGGVWYQTSNTTPFLYLPPVIVQDRLENGVTVPHYSLDVLITVRTPGNALIVLTGYFNYAIYEWAYYGIDAREYDEYTPFFWRFMPALPQGWVDDARADNPVRSVAPADRSANDG